MANTDTSPTEAFAACGRPYHHGDLFARPGPGGTP